MKYGICTFYYNNRNYGAILQAYALRKVVESLGVEAEMISYTNRTKVYSALFNIKKNLRRQHYLSSDFASRCSAIDSFRDSIPHSKLYYSNTISRINGDYDGFIVGSDQVWNPDWINQFTALSFSNSSKNTIAYAASLGKIRLSVDQQDKLKQALEKTNYISLREKESIPSLQRLTKKEIAYVLDPTLLLSRETWDDICSDRMIDEDYIFCYYLGGNSNLRNVAKELGIRKNLKIVALPYLNGKYREVDDGFGDYQLFDVSPVNYLSLVKHASFMMTDSFHGTVFAHMFETPFVVSGGGKDEMGCRMLSLTELFGTEDRYIKEHDDVSIDAVISLNDSPMVLRYDKHDAMLNHSMDFLKSALLNE